MVKHSQVPYIHPMKVYSYPVTVTLLSGNRMQTTVEAVNRVNAVRMALVRADELGLTVNCPAGSTLGSVLASGNPVTVGNGTFARFA